PPLDPSAAAAAAAVTVEGVREGPPHALCGSRARSGLEVTAGSRLGEVGGASDLPPPPLPPPPTPSTASGATICQTSGVAPHVQPRSGNPDAKTSDSQPFVSPPSVLEGQYITEYEGGRRRAGAAGTVSAEQGARSS
ncbi:unnamed protein product, partial [Laminaria digitata]